MNNRFVRPPRRLQRRGVRLDNVPLVPENLLPHKAQWQQPANEPPCGDVLIVLQLGISSLRKLLERVAVAFIAKGYAVTTLPVAGFP